MELTTEEMLADITELAHRGAVEEQVARGYAALESIGLDEERVEEVAEGVGLDGESFALVVAMLPTRCVASPIPAEQSSRGSAASAPSNGGFSEQDRRMLSVVKALLEKAVSDMTVQEAVQSQDADHKEMIRRLMETQEALGNIQGLLDDQRTVKQWYTPVELAELLGKAPFTVREWCRFGRINARKRPTGRGDADEWEISHEEVERYRNHGLLPIPSKY